MGRGAVAITVTSDLGQPVRLLTAHLKSKLLTFPGGRFQPHDESERARFAAYALYRRAAEAASLRTWATTTLAAQTDPVVLCGDLNDTVQAATTQLLLGPPGSEIDTRGFKIPDQGDAERLWNLGPLMPVERNYSRASRLDPKVGRQRARTGLESRTRWRRRNDGFASAPWPDVRRATARVRSRWTSRRSRQTARVRSIPRLS